MFIKREPCIYYYLYKDIYFLLFNQFYDIQEYKLFTTSENILTIRISHVIHISGIIILPSLLTCSTYQVIPYTATTNNYHIYIDISCDTHVLE